MSEKASAKESKKAQKRVGNKRGAAGKGSHGSTTKAGKVRGQTPKIPKSTVKVKPCPRVGGRKKYHRLFETTKHEKGQDWFKLQKR